MRPARQFSVIDSISDRVRTAKAPAQNNQDDDPSQYWDADPFGRPEANRRDERGSRQTDECAQHAKPSRPRAPVKIQKIGCQNHSAYRKPKACLPDGGYVADVTDNYADEACPAKGNSPICDGNVMPQRRLRRQSPEHCARITADLAPTCLKCRRDGPGTYP